jgi:hypothetical protein
MWSGVPSGQLDPKPLTGGFERMERTKAHGANGVQVEREPRTFGSDYTPYSKRNLDM